MLEIGLHQGLQLWDLGLGWLLSSAFYLSSVQRLPGRVYCCSHITSILLVNCIMTRMKKTETSSYARTSCHLLSVCGGKDKRWTKPFSTLRVRVSSLGHHKWISRKSPSALRVRLGRWLTLKPQDWLKHSGLKQYRRIVTQILRACLHC